MSPTISVPSPSTALDSGLQDLEQHPPKSFSERMIPSKNDQPKPDSHTQNTVYDIPTVQHGEEDTNRSTEIPPCMDNTGSEQLSAVKEQPYCSCANSSTLSYILYISVQQYTNCGTRQYYSPTP